LQGNHAVFHNLRKEIIMNTIKSILILATATLFAGSAYAGAGANVNACINLPTKPAKPMTVSVTAGGAGTHCMNDSGNNASFTVSSAGVTCTAVGYVEAKASSTKGDLCATDSSNWPLAYSIINTSFSGGTQSGWSGGGSRNSIDLQSQSKGTVVCGSDSVCNSTSWNWDHGTQGPLYIIFQPQSQ
jgi:hypothetical protein